MYMKWVLVPRFCELTGYSVDAVQSKIKSGVWAKGVHWRNSPDNRRQINLEAYEKWVEEAA